MKYESNLLLVCMDEKSKQLLEDDRNRIKGGMVASANTIVDIMQMSYNMFVAVSPTLSPHMVAIRKKAATKKAFANMITVIAFI